MKKVAIMTDSNSGITQEEGKALGIHVLAMPFFIDGVEFLEGVSLSQEDFYEKLEGGAEISTSMPSPASVMDMWDELLKEHDEVLHIPMSSGLSGSCHAAMALSGEYEGKVVVTDNLRIAITQKQAAMDAKALADAGKTAEEIKAHLEEVKLEFSIFLMVDTLAYLKKGGRITPAAAALGTLLKIKPILKLDEAKLDAFAKARTPKQAKEIIVKATKEDLGNKFGDSEAKDWDLSVIYTKNIEPALKFKEELKDVFPNHEISTEVLPLSISCHTGPGVIALAAVKKIK